MTGAISACQLGTLGLVGHAVMLSGPLGIANQASLALHLLAAGFWLGSLVPVILCLRIGADDPLRREAMAALTRFSNIGHVSVVLVVATGIVNIALIEGLSLNLGTPYRQLLAVKVAIVATMVALAIVNRYWLVPRLRRDAAALDRIRRICVIVFYLGLAAVGLVSVFGMLSPS
jgi:putative copper resistance protein D